MAAQRKMLLIIHNHEILFKIFIELFTLYSTFLTNFQINFQAEMNLLTYSVCNFYYI